MTLESVTGLVFSEKKDQVLMILRADVPVWVLPGGGIEVGETPEQAVCREVQEETGLLTEPVRLVGTYTPINRLSRKTALYECKPLSGSLRPSKESPSVRFFPLDALPKRIPPPYRTWIQEGLQFTSPIERPLSELTYGVLFRSFLLHPLLVFRFLLARLGLPINSNPVEEIMQDSKDHFDHDQNDDRHLES